MPCARIRSGLISQLVFWFDFLSFGVLGVKAKNSRMTSLANHLSRGGVYGKELDALRTQKIENPKISVFIVHSPADEWIHLGTRDYK